MLQGPYKTEFISLSMTARILNTKLCAIGQSQGLKLVAQTVPKATYMWQITCWNDIHTACKTLNDINFNILQTASDGFGVKKFWFCSHCRPNKKKKTEWCWNQNASAGCLSNEEGH